MYHWPTQGEWGIPLEMGPKRNKVEKNEKGQKIKKDEKSDEKKIFLI